MVQSGPEDGGPNRDQLLGLIHRSRALDAATRKHWLAVIDRLLPSQRQRLYDILSAEEEALSGDQTGRP